MGPSVPIEDDSIGVYKIEITDTPTGTEKYYIELTQESRRVRSDSDPPARKPDVWVTVSSSDLAAVLEGSLSPLQVRKQHFILIIIQTKSCDIFITNSTSFS